MSRNRLCAEERVWTTLPDRKWGKCITMCRVAVYRFVRIMTLRGKGKGIPNVH